MEIVVILEKHGKYVVLSKDYKSDHDVIGQFSSTTKMIARKKFSDPNQTDSLFAKQIKVAKEKGWTILYYGERLKELSLDEAKTL